MQVALPVGCAGRTIHMSADNHDRSNAELRLLVIALAGLMAASL